MYKQISIISLMLFMFSNLLYAQSPTSDQLTDPYPIGGFKTLQDSIIDLSPENWTV